MTLSLTRKNCRAAPRASPAWNSAAVDVVVAGAGDGPVEDEIRDFLRSASVRAGGMSVVPFAGDDGDRHIAAPQASAASISCRKKHADRQPG